MSSFWKYPKAVARLAIGTRCPFLYVHRPWLGYNRHVCFTFPFVALVGMPNVVIPHDSRKNFRQFYLGYVMPGTRGIACSELDIRWTRLASDNVISDI